MKREQQLALTLIFLISSFLIPLVVEGQPEAAEPSNVDILGPVVFSVQSGSVTIISPKNSSNDVNPIQLNFTVEATGLFGQFGNVGVSLDGGVIHSVTDFINKSVEEDTALDYWYRTTVLAIVTLPTLTEGTHNATVYYGYQYLGIPENPSLRRYEIFGHATVIFIVATPPKFPTMSIIAISGVLLVGTAIGLLVYYKKRKHKSTVSISNNN